MSLSPRQSIDVDSEEYDQGASWRRKGGKKTDNPYKGAQWVRQWVDWAAGFLGLTPEVAENPGRKKR